MIPKEWNMLPWDLIDGLHENFRKRAVQADTSQATDSRLPLSYYQSAVTLTLCRLRMFITL